MSIVWVDKYEEKQLFEQFNLGKNNFIAYKPKRAKYVVYQSANFNEDAIKAFIDDVLVGAGEYQKFQDDNIKLNDVIKKEEL